MHRSATAECQPAPDEIMPPSEMFRASPKRSESVKFVEFAAQSAMAAVIAPELGGVSRNHRLQRQPHFAHCDNVICAFFLFATYQSWRRWKEIYFLICCPIAFDKESSVLKK